MKSFFMEGDKLSMTRLLSFLTSITGLAIGVIGAVKGNTNAESVAIALGFVTAGITGKIIQKSKE